jgi:hypothetical protein
MSSLAELAAMSRERMLETLGTINGARLHDFLHSGQAGVGVIQP